MNSPETPSITKRLQQKIAERLRQKGVKPTPIRELVFKTLLSHQNPISLADLEAQLETIDKSTLFRTLNLFEEHHLVHAFEDGSGSIKYEACPNPTDCLLEDRHIHFYCTACKQTFCIPSTHIPLVELPKGFTTHSVNYTIKGLCPKCAKPIAKNG
ncbi:MAG: transcriptional repressor [Bacteroides sp.]|nr:transcriptional repressor [Ruminococcus flavefaciens]MCM1554225.1 transcriptional repressor [Bacteroides sp.]